MIFDWADNKEVKTFVADSVSWYMYWNIGTSLSFISIGVAKPKKSRWQFYVKSSLMWKLSKVSQHITFNNFNEFVTNTNWESSINKLIGMKLSNDLAGIFWLQY
jgi:hypothetical protein